MNTITNNNHNSGNIPQTKKTLELDDDDYFDDFFDE